MSVDRCTRVRPLCGVFVFGALAFAATVDPANAEGAADPPDDALIRELPFEADASEINRIIVDLAPPDGRPFRLWLDTGAQDSVLTPAAAKQNGVSIRRTKRSPYITSTSLGVPLRFWVDTRWSDQSSGVGWEYGLLGGRFLAQFVVEFDFDAAVVRFYDPRKFSVPETATAPDEFVAPVRLTSNRPFIEVDVGGEKPLQVLLDTGAPGTLLASAKALRKIGLDTRELPAYALGQFTRGRTELKLEESQSVRIGPFEFGEVPMAVAPRGAFNLGGNTDSLIGYDLISQFKVRIDYPNERLWLKRRENTRSTFMGTDVAIGRETGAYLATWPGVYQVRFVRPGSPAEAYGLRVGDQFDATAAGTEKLDAEAIATAITTGGTLRGVRPTGRKEAVAVEFPGGQPVVAAAGVSAGE